MRQAVIANTRVLSPRIVNDARFAWNEFDNFITSYYSNKTGRASYVRDPGSRCARSLSFGDSRPFGTGLQLPQPNHSVCHAQRLISGGGRPLHCERQPYDQSGRRGSPHAVQPIGQSSARANSISTAGPLAIRQVAPPRPDTLSPICCWVCHPRPYRLTAEANGMMRSTLLAGYIQDDWKVTRKLTLNLGLRYENTRPWVDKYNRHDQSADYELGSWIRAGQCSRRLCSA